MTKQDLEQLSDLKNEIRLLTQEITSCRTQVVSDTVIGSTSSRIDMHAITITGINIQKLDKLGEKLNAKLDKLQELVLDIENGIEEIEDSQTRSIVRLYYRNGLTQEEIGKELGYTQSAVSLKLKKFIEGCE